MILHLEILINSNTSIINQALIYYEEHQNLLEQELIKSLLYKTVAVLNNFKLSAKSIS